jgi:hypothetical protein
MSTRYQVTQLAAPNYRPIGPVEETATFVRMLDVAKERLAGSGLRPPAHSRLDQARGVLMAPWNGNAVGLRTADETLRCGLEACRVAIEFCMISQSLPRRLARKPRIRSLIQRAYAGHLDPQAADQTSSRARDAQFELWLGSWFAMGGRPVEAREPDLRAALWFRWYGVAAKRVRARGQLLARAQNAAQQVRSWGDIGIVALSLDNYSDTAVESAVGVEPGDRFFAQFGELEAVENWLSENAPWVKGVLCFGFLGAWAFPNDQLPRIELTSCERIMLLGVGEPERQHLLEVLDESRDLRHRRWSLLLSPGPTASSHS